MSETGVFSQLSDDVILKILHKLEEDPRNWARVACVSTEFSSIIRTVCFRVKWAQSIPAVVSDLLPSGAWASLYKLAGAFTLRAKVARPRDEYEYNDMEKNKDAEQVDKEDMEKNKDAEQVDKEENDANDGKTKRKGGRPDIIHDYPEEEDDGNGDYGVGASGAGRKRHGKAALEFFDEEEAADQVEEDFIDTGADINEEKVPLPSVSGTKLWLVKCTIGQERKLAVRLWQKSIGKGNVLQIKSCIARDDLKGYIYIEADKEAYIREVVKGMRGIYSRNITLVPITEMEDVMKVKNICRGWVRMTNGRNTGDLAKVVDVDNVRRTATVKLIPTTALNVGQSQKSFAQPSPQFMNIKDRKLHTGDLKDGFLYENVSFESFSTEDVNPTLDELQEFRQLDNKYLSTLFAKRKKDHFVKGDRVRVVQGDIKNLDGWVDKVEEDIVYIKPNKQDLPETLAIRDKELCKYFAPGNHVKVVSGATEGATGTVVSVDGHKVNITLHGTKEILQVCADYLVDSSMSGVTQIGGSAATPPQDGTKTPMRDREWHPFPQN